MKVIILIVFISGFIFLLAQLPIITGKASRQVRHDLDNTEIIELSGKTLFLSDMHITAEPSLDQQFNLDFSYVTNVVIVGDFLDSVWDFESFGDTEEERFRVILKSIVPERFTGAMYYIHALTHDPQALSSTHITFPNFDFYHIGRYGNFLIDGVPVVAYHGDQLHGGFVGGGVSWLAEKFGHSLLLERLGRTRFKIPKGTWIINGHSHVPGINQKEKVANTGSFVGAPFNKYIFRIHVGTGVLFDYGKVELQEYEGINIKKQYPYSN
jgi:predicted phosphodiesterase